MYSADGKNKAVKTQTTWSWQGSFRNSFLLPSTRIWLRLWVFYFFYSLDSSLRGGNRIQKGFTPRIRLKHLYRHARRFREIMLYWRSLPMKAILYRHAKGGKQTQMGTIPNIRLKQLLYLYSVRIASGLEFNPVSMFCGLSRNDASDWIASLEGGTKLRGYAQLPGLKQSVSSLRRRLENYAFWGFTRWAICLLVCYHRTRLLRIGSSLAKEGTQKSDERQQPDWSNRIVIAKEV